MGAMALPSSRSRPGGTPSASPSASAGPRVRRRRSRGFDLHLSLSEESHEFLREQADHFQRSLSKHASFMMEALTTVQRQLDPAARDRLDALLRNPEQLRRVLELAVAPTGQSGGAGG